MDYRDGKVWNTNIGLGCAPANNEYLNADYLSEGGGAAVGFHHNLNSGANFLFPGGNVEWHKRDDYQPGWQSNPNAALRSDVNGSIAAP
jgi:hypothetical protein